MASSAPKDFAMCQLKNELLAGILEKGWKHLKPVQEMALPIILQGKDVLVSSPKGSGKTGTLAIALLQKMDPSLEGATAIIVVPSEERAQSTRCMINSLASKMVRNDFVVIGIPAMILDLLEKNVCRASKCNLFIVDDVDEMLPIHLLMLDAICDRFPANRQIVVVGTEIPAHVDNFFGHYNLDPSRIKIEEVHDVIPVKSVEEAKTSLQNPVIEIDSSTQHGSEKAIMEKTLADFRLKYEKVVAVRNELESEMSVYRRQVDRLLGEKLEAQNALTQSQREFDDFRKTKIEEDKISKATIINLQNEVDEKNLKLSEMTKTLEDARNQKCDPVIEATLEMFSKIQTISADFMARKYGGQPPIPAADPKTSKENLNEGAGAAEIVEPASNDKGNLLDEGARNAEIAKPTSNDKRKLSVNAESREPKAKKKATTALVNRFNPDVDYGKLAGENTRQVGKKFFCMDSRCSDRKGYSTKQEGERHFLQHHCPKRPCTVEGCTREFSLNDKYKKQLEEHLKTHDKTGSPKVVLNRVGSGYKIPLKNQPHK